jgi:hypothetical protein
MAASRTTEPQPRQKLENAVPSLEVQRWPEVIPFSTPGRHRWHAVLEQPVGRVHLAGVHLLRVPGHARGGPLIVSPARTVILWLV